MTRYQKKVILYTDGGARGNPGPAAFGFLVEDTQGNVLTKLGKYIGKTTNNVAEYAAVIAGLGACIGLGATSVEVYSDSQLLVKQLNGEYKVRAEHLQPLFMQVKENMRSFDYVTFTHVRRSHQGTTRADALVNMALDEEVLKQSEQ